MVQLFEIALDGPVPYSEVAAARDTGRERWTRAHGPVVDPVVLPVLPALVLPVPAVVLPVPAVVSPVVPLPVEVEASPEPVPVLVAPVPVPVVPEFVDEEAPVEVLAPGVLVPVVPVEFVAPADGVSPAAPLAV